MIVISQCYKCKRYNEADICRAFPDGIPSKIFTGEADHTKPFPGDHGIQFEAI